MTDFLKMHGLGNDFVILDNQKGDLALDSAKIREMCDRRRGVGCDQLIVLERPDSDEADLFMRIYNPDGSESGACGNATRCVAYDFFQKTGESRITIETAAGLLVCHAAGDAHVTVDMGMPGLNWQDIPLAHEADTLHLPVHYKSYGAPVAVSMGNPHCVFFVADAEAIDLEADGKPIETHELFPKRTNVEFATVRGRDRIRMRVWERGAGITQACGTGACAVTVAAIRRGLTDNHVTVTLDGGDLHIEWDQKNGRVFMTGPAAYAFDGSLKDA